MSDVKTAIAAWHKTLRKYKADRPLMPGEDLAIGRYVQMYGLEIVLLAFLGAEHEPASDKFTPGPQHCRLARIFRKDTDTQVGIQYFLGIGAKVKNQQEQSQKKAEAVAAEEITENAPPPEEVLAFIRGLGKGMP